MASDLEATLACWDLRCTLDSLETRGCGHDAGRVGGDVRRVAGQCKISLMPFSATQKTAAVDTQRRLGPPETGDAVPGRRRPCVCVPER